MLIKAVLSGYHDYPTSNIRSMIADSISRMGYTWDECQWGSTPLQRKKPSPTSPKCLMSVFIHLPDALKARSASSLAQLGCRNRHVRIAPQVADGRRLVVFKQLWGGPGSTDCINPKSNQTGGAGTMAARSGGHTYPTESRYCVKLTRERPAAFGEAIFCVPRQCSLCSTY